MRGDECVKRARRLGVVEVVVGADAVDVAACPLLQCSVYPVMWWHEREREREQTRAVCRVQWPGAAPTRVASIICHIGNGIECNDVPC